MSRKPHFSIGRLPIMSEVIFLEINPLCFLNPSLAAFSTRDQQC